MYIEDAELREIYKTATVERLDKLEAALMHLEKYPDNLPKLEEFLREAHTLKGDSRMLGINDVETLSHQIEDCLASVKRGETVLTQDLCDRLYQGIDAIRQLAREAVTGEPAEVNLFYVLAQLMGAISGEAEEQLETPLTESIFEEQLFNDELLINPQTVAQTPSQPAVLDQPSTTDEINTVRVEAEKLDVLMRQAGELSVTKLRMAQRLNQVEELLRLYEEWSRDTVINRTLGNPERGNANDMRLLQNFHRRAEKRLERLGNLVSRLKQEVYEDTARLGSVADELESGIQNLRLLPLSTLFNQFNRLVRDLAKQQGKQINLVIEGQDTRADKRIIEEMKDPLLHIIRNAIDHGIETPQERALQGKSPTATIVLQGYQTGSSIGIKIRDDGRGLDFEAIKQTALRRGVVSQEELATMNPAQIQSLIFIPGFSTRTEVTEISGRGIGLDVVKANVEKLKGSIAVESNRGKGCEFQIWLGTNLATTHALLVGVAQSSYAIPVESVETMLLVARQEIFSLEGSQTITFAEQPVSVVWLADLLELPIAVPSSPKALDITAKSIPCIILKFGTERLGLLVDALLDRQDIVLKPQSKLLKRVRNITGATILGNGEVCMVLNPQDLLKTVQKGSGAVIARGVEQTSIKHKLLLVEDSIIIRTQLKRLLEAAGYELTVAVDGLDGFNKLRAGTFDAVVSDVEMPNMTGLALTAKIRQHAEYRELPIILVTTLASDEDKRRGAEAGANAYLTKGSFDQKILLDTLKRLI